MRKHMTLMAPRDAGRMLGVSTSRVIQLARSGRLPEIRDSANRRLFWPEDVERLAKERRRDGRGTGSLERRGSR